MEDTLRLILDMIILMSLAAMIFYAIRLTASLNNFRRYKGEFERLMRDVSVNIDQAQKSIEELKMTSRETGGDLQKTVDESRYLIDELRLMNEAAEALAVRLEKGSVREPQSREKNVDMKAPKAQSVDAPSFFIQDRDYEEPAFPQSTVSHKEADNFETPTQKTIPRSRAEQELLAALTKKKRG